MENHGGLADRKRMAGKIVLITGGGRGMGPVHARLLAEHGARVVLGGRNLSQVEVVAGTLRAESLDASHVPLDVTREDDWIKAIASIENSYGQLNVLVNNAGVSSTPNVLDCSLVEWNAVVAVNQTGTFLGMKHAAPAIKRAGGGSIVNISSVLGTLGTEFGIAYHASKGAVHLLTRAAAVMLAPDIRVNSVTPGITATDMGNSLGAERLKVRVAAYPMGRAGQSIEVSQAVLFLASDDSSFVTGADYRVDGGALAGVKHRT